MSKMSKKPRWIVACVGHPTMRLSAHQAATPGEAQHAYMAEHGKKLRLEGGFVLVTDCETGRETRYRIVHRGAKP